MSPAAAEELNRRIGDLTAHFSRPGFKFSFIKFKPNNEYILDIHHLETKIILRSKGFYRTTPFKCYSLSRDGSWGVENMFENITHFMQHVTEILDLPLEKLPPKMSTCTYIQGEVILLRLKGN